jgi:hypothetical protein
MSDRLFDRNNYSSKTLENFEIMSAFYVDIFYNHLYIEAKKLKAGGNVASITEGYKHTLNAFLKGLENPKLYKKNIVGIHHYFITVGFASISFAKCVDKLTKEFIPTDYFNSITVTQKMGVLRMVLNQSMKTFIRKIVDDHMVKIIDFHKEIDNVRILQDELIDCFILERESMYQRFIAENTKTNKNETVNRLLAEKMQLEIKRLVKEKYAQQTQILILKKILLKKKNADNKVSEVIGNLHSEIEILKSKQQINNTQTTHFFKQQPDVRQPDVRQPDVRQPDVRQPDVRQPDVRQPDVRQPDVRQHPLRTHRSKVNQSSEKIEVVTDANDSENHSQNNDIYNDDSSFIEVNNNNIHDIIQSNSDELYQFNNTKMDEETTLEDF